MCMQYFSATLYFLVKITKNEYFFKTSTELAQHLSSNFSVVRMHTQREIYICFSGHFQVSCACCTVLERSARKHLGIAGVLLFTDEMLSVMLNQHS